MSKRTFTVIKDILRMFEIYLITRLLYLIFLILFQPVTVMDTQPNVSLIGNYTIWLVTVVIVLIVVPIAMDQTAKDVRKISSCVKMATVSTVLVIRSVLGHYNVMLKENANASQALLETSVIAVKIISIILVTTGASRAIVMFGVH